MWLSLLLSGAGWAQSLCPKPTLFATPLFHLYEVYKQAQLRNDSSPFLLACHDEEGKKSLHGRPRIDFQSLALIDEDRGRKTGEFFASLLVRKERQIAAQELEHKTFRDCLTSALTSTCRTWRRVLHQALEDGTNLEVSDTVESLFRRLINNARYQLAFAQHSKWGTGSATESRVNSRMDAVGRFRPWTPLNEEQVSEAIRELIGIREQNLQILGKEISQGKTKPQDISSTADEIQWLWRLERDAKYNSLVTRFPTLNFVRDENISRDELLKNLEEQNQHLQRQKAPLQLLRQLHRASPKSIYLLDLFEDRDLVEGFLLENPQYCGLAVALTQIRDNLSLQSTGAVVAGFAAISTAGLPLTLLTLTSLTAGGVFTIKDFERLQRQKDLLLGRFKSNPDLQRLAVQDVKSLSQDEQLVWANLLFAGALPASARFKDVLRQLKKR